MRFPRSSGILLHPTSLPGRYGIGDLGRDAYYFVDVLHEAGQKLWQVLPLNPTGYGDSPYQCFSAFAGNPLLISLDALLELGLLEKSDIADMPAFPDDHVEFGKVIPWKYSLLNRAAHRFAIYASQQERGRFAQFCFDNRGWLDDYALFMACKENYGGHAWTEWFEALAARNSEELKYWSEKLADKIAAHKFWQYEFFREWRALKSYCAERNIRIMGDLPIYVAHDSADVWSHPELFYLDEFGKCTKVAGVPPDYYSATGQLWGNPIYRWDYLSKTGFDWWIKRCRASLSLYDMVRLDHFRGFEAYWEIPAGEPTAIKGEWVKGPGAALFQALEKALGELPIVAENLGVITPEVEELRNQFGFPGMAILQFAFGIDAQATAFRPHCYERNLVAYTATHDNDTTMGWWNGGVGASIRTVQEVETEHAFAEAYLGANCAPKQEPMNWVLIRHVMASVADTVLIPMQDVLGLGNEARMNLPGTFGGNWKWRYLPGDLKPEYIARLKEFCRLYDR